MNTARFLNQFSVGQGDYTNERQELFGQMTVDEVVGEINAQQQP